MFKVLIVDDNINDRQGVADVLDWRALGVASVDFAENGEIGLAVALETLPDLIITDVSMPVMDGIEMALKISEHAPEIRFIFMSCFENVEYLKAAINVHSCAYILKPIDISKLKSAIMFVIDELRTEKAQTGTIKKLEERIESLKPMLREQLVRDLLYGNIDNGNGFFADSQYKKFSVAALRIGQSDSDPMTSYSRIYEVKKRIEEIGNGQITAVIQNYNSLALLILTNESEDGILLVLKECKDAVNMDLGLSVTCIIGEISDKPECIHKLYSECETALVSNMYTRADCILFAKDLLDGNSALSVNMQVLRDDIYAIFENGGEDVVRNFIEKYFSQDVFAAEGEVKGLCFTIVSVIQMYLCERGDGLENIFADNAGGGAIWNKLLKFETILDGKQWMFNIITITMKHLNGDNTGRDAKIVRDIKSIVEKNYNTVENISEVARQVFLSVNHANFLFKSVTGETIFDYLIKVRMENAKKMLADQYCKIYEVAENVGYKSKPYFASVFKEYTGMTPKEYRNKL